ncbi:MAG: zinc ribbon domain-containing protein [Anaerolineales bacterium]|nr:zinc ribbon domain-containing protein [Anaerolineales bacterium]
MNNTPRFCENCGSAIPSGAKFCESCGQPVRAVAPAPAAPVSPPARAQAVPRPPARRGKKPRWGCCLGCLGSMVFVAAALGLLFFWWANRPSDMLTLGKRSKIDSQNLVLSGGTWTVQDSGSAIDGLSINIPEGAYEGETQLTISTRPIEGHKFGVDFNPITPLIHIANGGEFAADGMTVSAPIEIGPDEFAMGFYYDEKTGALEGIPLLELTSGRATVATSHFSDMLFSKIPLSELANTDVDTGFNPGVDDWQFVNEGSIIAKGGHCAGQSLTAMWYYYEKVLGAGERRLYGRYDNNNYGYGTIDFQEDDSWGYRWASVVQNEQWDKGLAVFRLWGLSSDRLSWYSFAYAMKLTGEPQYVSIGRYVEEDGKQERRGHALIAYKIENNHLWVADPNYPGQADRYINFENGGFQPYASGENARDIAASGVRAYTEIHYLGKTAMIDWGKIGAEYEKLLDGKAGEGHFPNYNFSYLAEFDPTTGAATWLPMPELLELDETETAKASEAYRGKLLVAVNMNPRTYQVTRYVGTQKIESKQSTGQSDVQFPVSLDVGVNDWGFLIENLEGGEAYYNDFRRVKVIYEVPDLSGTWEGVWQIEQAFNAMRYIEDAIVWALVNTGAVESEAEAREIAAASITEAPNLYDERPLTVILTALDPDKLDRYKAEVYQLADDGSTMTYSGEATLSGGVFTLKTESGGDGSRFTFTGTLASVDSLSGEFGVTAWMVVQDAVTGSWRLDRQD